MAKARALSVADKRWQAEQDLRAIQEAEEIKSNPARLRAAKIEAQKKLKALKKVAGPEKKKPAPRKPKQKAKPKKKK